MTDLLRDRLQSSLGQAYTLDRELSGGGMSRVFVAREDALGRDVVVKVLPPELAQGLSIGRFTREIRLAAALQEPHIVPLLTAGTTADGLPYYIMPYVRGQSLRARMDAGPIPTHQAAGILRDVARALAYAHHSGIVHRDVKPENVLLHEGTAVVTDFGIAKALSVSRTAADGTENSALTQLGTSLGTPAYMAPEQAAGDPTTDHRADLYAWGLMAYELLAGRHPFADRTSPQQLLAAQLGEMPAPLRAAAPSAPVTLCELIMRCLAKDPAERPASAAAIIEAMEALSFSGASEAQRRRAPEVTTRQTRALALGAAVVLVMIVGATILALRGRENSPDIATQAAGATGAQATSSMSTLAVLPFVNTGGDTRDDYFSDGLTDELAHALARLPGLRLAGRSSSFAFKGRVVPAEEVGRALNVAGVVEGTVRRAGDRLRVTAQLTSTLDGKVRWSDSYESSSADVFQVQDELTSAIVAALRPALGAAPPANLAEASRGTSSAEAYDLYLRGRHFWELRGGQNLLRAATYFRRSLAVDPTFARAQAGLAMTYGVLPGYVADPADTLTARALAASQHALVLDSSLADARLALAVALDNLNDVRGAERELLVALALEPENVTAHQWYGNNLLAQGRPAEAVAALRRAEALDPLSGVVQGNLAQALLGARRFDEALAASRRMMEIAPDRSDPSAAAPVYLFAGLPDSALLVIERMRSLDPDIPGIAAMLALTHAALGHWAQVDSIRAALSRPGADRSGGVNPALAALAAGDRAPLLQLLATPAGQRHLRYEFLTLGCTPLLDPIMNDARYIAIIEELGVRRCLGKTPWPIRPRR